MATLYQHQKDAIEIAKEGNLCLFHDCGTGKTLTAIEIIKIYISHCAPICKFGPGGDFVENYPHKKALVVCPLSIIEGAWMTDLQKFAPELSVVSLHDKVAKKRLRKLKQKRDVYVINYEQFKLIFDEISDQNFNIVIVDESSKMKGQINKSQITRALLALAGIKYKSRGGPNYKSNKPIPHRYVLSGKPAPNSEYEYWSQVKFVTGPGNEVFNDNYFVFRNQFFQTIMLGHTIRKFKLHKSLKKEFADRVRRVSHVIKKADVLDLPPQVFEVRKIYLSKTEQAAYNQLKRELLLKYENETILASTALVEIMKLRQLASGFFYNKDGKATNIGNSKINELKSLLEEIGDYGVIIWVQFTHEAYQVKNLLGNDADILAGTAKARKEIIENFNNNNLQYLIVSPRRGGHGLSLRCGYSVYYSLDYSLENHEQSINRTHGINRGIAGQSSTYYYLLADKTIDEVIYKSLQRKASLSDEILNYLKKERSRL